MNEEMHKIHKVCGQEYMIAHCIRWSHRTAHRTVHLQNHFFRLWSASCVFPSLFLSLALFIPTNATDHFGQRQMQKVQAKNKNNEEKNKQ